MFSLSVGDCCTASKHSRPEYEISARINAKRGMDLPQTKLPTVAIIDIRKSAEMRDQLRREITEKYSNEALARKWGVHVRTIEKVLSYETARHVR